MAPNWLTGLVGSKWTGSGELWLDPEGNQADRCDCAMHFDADALHYTWSYEGQAKEGSFTFEDGGASWVDSWHQTKPAKCVDVKDDWGLFTVAHTYGDPPGPPWGWRSKFSERPDGSLVLQMTNITPWGEDGRAVRMIFTRAE
jgi:hypothetical protein